MSDALKTDLYQLKMMYGYFKKGMANKRACFEMFFRRCPFGNGYAVFAGLDEIVEYLCNLHFEDRQIDYLKPLFDDDFLDFLRHYRFNCDVDAVPEGMIVFPNETLVRVTGPLISAQFVETRILELINYPTTVATKAARMRLAAGDDFLMEFGRRRAPSDAANIASRAAIIGGFNATSNVEAGFKYGIPIAGTQAHSWVQAFPSELEALRAYADVFPDDCSLIVDTYGVLKSGVPNLIIVAKEQEKKGKRVESGRIDSGDLAYLSKEMRKMLDGAGLGEVKIVGSNDLDEYLIRSLKQQEAKIRHWGVGTKVVVPDDTLGGVYKLVAIEENGKWISKIKISDNPEKMINPGLKKVYRIEDKEKFFADVMMLEDEEEPKKGEELIIRHPAHYYKRDKFLISDDCFVTPLLQPIFRNGIVRVGREEVPKIAERCRKGLAKLHEGHKRFENPHIYRVALSDKLYKLKMRMIARATKN